MLHINIREGLYFSLSRWGIPNLRVVSTAVTIPESSMNRVHKWFDNYQDQTGWNSNIQENLITGIQHKKDESFILSTSVSMGACPGTFHKFRLGPLAKV